MKIILDAMGGDNAPQAPVLGAVQAAKDFGAEITLVGKENQILEDRHISERLEIKSWIT